ncbi:MAG: VOC family protein [Chloroflexia bacterium]
MSTVAQPMPATSIDPATGVGLLALTVSDLERSLLYYTEAIGLAVLRRDGNTATLGVANRPLLVLTEQPGAAEWPRGGRSYTGLYHFAILMPTRADLGRWLRNWLELGLPLPGQGDHIVSEALYLEDPDGHGIEVYRDRPREGWQWQNGQSGMGTGPVDIAACWKKPPARASPGPVNHPARFSGTCTCKSAISPRQRPSTTRSSASTPSRKCRAPFVSAGATTTTSA